jgi:hypothetical protein
MFAAIEVTCHWLADASRRPRITIFPVMESCTYLIIGRGLAADAAARGIREVDQHGSILIVSDEEISPYNRPPLSKALWKGTGVLENYRFAGATQQG